MRRCAELHIVDFDGTTFRSPTPNWSTLGNDLCGVLVQPPCRHGLGWFHTQELMYPPFVPLAPAASAEEYREWYVDRTVQKMKELLADPERYYVATLTGRSEEFRPRVKQLLSDVGVMPHEVLLKPSDTLGTSKYKAKEIARLITGVQPAKVVMYEDLAHHARDWDALLRDFAAMIAVRSNDIERKSRLFAPLNFAVMDPAYTSMTHNVVLLPKSCSDHFLPPEQEAAAVALLRSKYHK